MSIDPRFAFYFGVWTSVLLLVASGTINFTGALPELWVPIVTKWCGILGAINSTILTAASGYSSSKPGPMVNLPASVTQPAVKILLVAFALSFLVAGGSAQAQSGTRPRIPFDPLKLNDQTIAGTKAAPATPSPLVCDFSIFNQLKPDNLVSIIKTCVNTQKQELVDSTQAALDSAKAFTPNPDQDAVNCLTPGLALFKAAMPIPAVPAKDAVPATATTPEIPAVAAQPEREPGLILLFQKYREFVLAGALTSCQSWVNTPVNATVAAGIGAAAGTAAGVALLAPK